MLAQVVRQAPEVHHGLHALLLERRHARRHEPPEPEAVALAVVEGHALVVERVLDDLDAAVVLGQLQRPPQAVGAHGAAVDDVAVVALDDVLGGVGRDGRRAALPAPGDELRRRQEAAQHGCARRSGAAPPRALGQAVMVLARTAFAARSTDLEAWGALSIEMVRDFRR